MSLWNKQMQLGLELALMGLMTVFIFLIVLIFLTIMMSKTVSAIEQRMLQPVTSTPVVSERTNAIPEELLKTIIVEAVQQHRTKTHHHPVHRKEV